MSTVPEEYEPVAHVARNLSGASSSEVVLDESNETDSDVQQHDPGVSLQVDPNGRTTMSRKHCKAVLEGIDRLNHQDALVKSSFGLTDLPFAEPTTLVITSHPRLFQELQTHDHVADVFDVGVGAENANQDENPKVWYDVLQDYKNIIIAVGYGQDTDALKHGKILSEVESHCDMNGYRFLHIDVANTERWEEHMFPQIPHTSTTMVWRSPAMIPSGLSFSSRGSVVAQWMIDWLCEWTNETNLEDEMSVAFIGELQEELMEDDQQLDVIWDEEDRAQVNPVEELISEETLVDEVDIPQLMSLNDAQCGASCLHV